MMFSYTGRLMRMLRVWLDDFGHDLRHGAKGLGRSKGFTATALLSLALGIGANAGIFTWLDQVLLRQLQVREPERLVELAWLGNAVGVNYGSGATMSYPLCRDLAEQTAIFEGVFCRYPTEVNISSGREHELTRAEIVSGSYFPVLGIAPYAGRVLSPEDDGTPGEHPVVMVSYVYWMTRLNGAADVVGSRLLVNNYPMTVIGIAPPSFRGVDPAIAPAVWIPAAMKRQVTPEWDGLESRRTFWMHVVARLRPGVSAESAQARLQPWFKQMLESDLQHQDFPPVTDPQRRGFLASTIEVSPAARGVSPFRAGLERPLRVLMGGAMLLLALTTLNLAGLLLARGLERRRDLATRMALGASRGRITRQLMVESALLIVAGAVLGIAVAPVVARVLQSFLPAGYRDPGINGRVVLFTTVVSAMAGLVCGVAPLVELRRGDLSARLTERATTGLQRIRARRLLISGQVAVALILLVAAGLFVETLRRLHDKGPGFATAGLLMFSLDPQSIGESDARSEQVMREVLRRLEERPEIARVAIASTQLLNGGSAGGSLTIAAEGRRVTDRIVYRLRVGPAFFQTLGVSLVDGRDFGPSDVRPAGTPPGPYRTAIVNETFARRYFGTRSPVGARIGAGNRPDTPTDVEIIGVVHEISRRNLRDRDIDEVFYNFWDNQSENGAFYVRARDTAAAARVVRAVVADVEPRLPVMGLTTVDDQIERSLSTERALATISTGFSAVALIVSVVGLYGVMAFMVAQRRREIGLRMALGASRRDAMWLVGRDAAAIVAGGLVVALPAVWWSKTIVETQLFDLTALHAPTILLAVASLALAAGSAVVIPAWRASHVDPNVVLRAE